LNLTRGEEDLSDIVEHAVELARPSVLQHRIEVRVDGSVTGLSVNVDGRLLQRVLLNLVLNAADAIGEAGTPNGQIIISSERQHAKTAIFVEDNGPGIPEEVLERIFNPFFTTKHSGTGLGLAIVHRIIEAHGGSIAAENLRPPARGARFKIVI
jgi:two-component system sensor histidine kinase HydH